MIIILFTHFQLFFYAKLLYINKALGFFLGYAGRDGSDGAKGESGADGIDGMPGIQGLFLFINDNDIRFLFL